MHVVPNRVLTNLATESPALTYGGEYIGFKNNTVYGPGNVDSNNVATVTRTVMTANGPVHYISRILEFSDAFIGTHLEKLGGTSAATSQYYNFFQYLRNSTIWNNATKEIAGIPFGSFVTFLVPNNAAILKAVNDGLLPGTGTAPNKVPTFNPTVTADKELVVAFIQFHVLNKKIVAADQVENGAIETLMKNNVGDVTTVFVNNAPGSLRISDQAGRIANVISPSSYYLSNRAFIHLLDNYLKY
jgi:hypothetical protein